MTLALRLAAQLAHIALILLAAPTLLGLLAWLEARLAGRDGPHWAAPWQELRRLWRKQSVLPETRSPVAATAPLLCCAGAALAAFLVPSFALDMAFAPAGDLLVLAALMGAMRGTLALAALDDGSAHGVLAARSAGLWAICGEPALLLAILVLGLAGGTTNVDLLAGLQQARMLQPVAAMALVGGALGLLAFVQHDTAAPVADAYTASDLALLRLSDGLRLVFWLDLIGAIFLPFGLSAADDFPIGWAVGLLAWVLRLLLLSAVLAGGRVLAGRIPPRRAPALLGVSLLLVVMAAVLVLSQARPV